MANGFLLGLTRLLGLTIEVPLYSTFCHQAGGLEVPKPARPAGGGPLHLAIPMAAPDIAGVALGL